MEQVVNGSGVLARDSAVIDTKNQWTCEQCTTVNTIATQDGDITITMNACTECGAVRQSDEPMSVDEAREVFNINDLTPGDIAAGLQNLSGGMATAQDVENAARAEEGLPPIDPALPFDFTPFNPDNALKTIFDKQAAIKELQDDYEDKKSEAAHARKALDDGNKELIRLIESFKKQRTQALNPSQPYLSEATDAAPTASCPWERAHPGQTCQVCAEAKRIALSPAVESPVHPEHEGHEGIAEAARAKNVLEPLAADLEKIELFASALELSVLSTEDLEALKVYVDEPTPLPPQLLARCCRAATPGSLMQVCENCQTNLMSTADIEAEGRDWYPSGALVGFECTAYVERASDECRCDCVNCACGDCARCYYEPSVCPTKAKGVERATDQEVTEAAGELEAAIEPPVEEAPRKPRSHAKKKATRKAAPEDERKAQASEGKKRSAPKAKKVKR